MPLSHILTPSTPLYRFRQDQIGQSWGYPYCWSEYCLSTNVGGSGMKGANTVWAWPSFMSAGYTDEWCRENTNPSELSMPGHSAPLGITFYNYQEDVSCEGGFGHWLHSPCNSSYHNLHNSRLHNTKDCLHILHHIYSYHSNYS